MATTFTDTSSIRELDSSPTFVAAGINSTMQRQYQIKAASDSAALILVQGAAPSTATVDSIPLEAPRVITVKRVGQGSYEATVDYKHAGRDEREGEELVEVGDERVSGDFSGQTIHVTIAKAQTKYGTDAPDVGLAINQNYDGSVDGTEKNVRSGTFTVETLIDGATVTNAWLKARYQQIWTFNDATFRSWPAGSVALVGFVPRLRSDGNWDISYSFQIFEEETVTELGGVDLGGSVYLEGRQFKWVMYRPKVDAGGKLSSEPIGAYVADLYDESDFSDLGIAT
ncbi:MAG: hypothetical protein E6Q97_08635 [Desulfurellales bacterium]|nr:MAG: hypothetical protein E6Q97_08635 [Desulfurellales bacterium]